MTRYIIEARNLAYEYGDGTEALKNINLKIEEGKKIAVLGINGAGKSTLFLHFNGTNRPKTGEILYQDKPLGYSNQELVSIRKEVGIVFQEPDSQLFSASVLQEISFGPMNLKLDKSEVIKRVERAMETTGISELRNKPTHFLSYGQKKRVAIAAVLAMEPSLLILDEPTSGLDLRNAEAVIDILNERNNHGTTIIVSTHDIDMAYTWADYIYVMYQGEIIGQGIPEEVFTNEELLHHAGVKQPWIIEVYTELFGKNSDKGLPRTKQNLCTYIKSNLMDT